MKQIIQNMGSGETSLAKVSTPSYFSGILVQSTNSLNFYRHGKNAC